jgi:hypothetical protein
MGEGGELLRIQERTNEWKAGATGRWEVRKTSPAEGEEDRTILGEGGGGARREKIRERGGGGGGRERVEREEEREKGKERKKEREKTLKKTKTKAKIPIRLFLEHFVLENLIFDRNFFKENSRALIVAPAAHATHPHASTHACKGRDVGRVNVCIYIHIYIYIYIYTFGLY